MAKHTRYNLIREVHENSLEFCHPQSFPLNTEVHFGWTLVIGHLSLCPPPIQGIVKCLHVPSMSFSARQWRRQNYEL